MEYGTCAVHSNQKITIDNAEFRISFQDITVQTRMTGCMDHLVKEATEIWLHQNNLNRDVRFTLSCSQYAATCLLSMEGPSKSTVMKHQWQVKLHGLWWLHSLTPPTVKPTVCTGTGHHWSPESVNCSTIPSCCNKTPLTAWIHSLFPQWYMLREPRACSVSINIMCSCTTYHINLWWWTDSSQNTWY
jgi:hypothetical protein